MCICSGSAHQGPENDSLALKIFFPKFITHGLMSFYPLCLYLHHTPNTCLYLLANQPVPPSHGVHRLCTGHLPWSTDLTITGNTSGGASLLVNCIQPSREAPCLCLSSSLSTKNTSSLLANLSCIMIAAPPREGEFSGTVCHNTSITQAVA